MATKGFYTANQIVDEAVEGYDRRRYGEAVKHFHRGFRDFQLFSNEAISEEWVPITLANTVNFPEDLMRVLWIGVSINGELFSFTKSNKIVSPISAPMDDFLDEDRGETEGVERGPSYGYGSKGVNAEFYYTVEPERRRIILKRPAIEMIRLSDRSEVLIGYVGHGVRKMDSTYIYGDAANMLIAYIEWKLTADDKRAPHWRIQMKKTDYLEAKAMYDTLSLPSIDELYDAIYETSSPSIRRV